DGSDEVNATYEFPLSPRDTSLRMRYRSFASRIIQPPLDSRDITSQARTYDLTVRHPLIKMPTEEIAIGLTLSRQSSRNLLSGEDFLPTADDRGRTQISAVRWFQEWVKRGDRQAFAARSQFSLGVDWFDATDNSSRDLPDGQFFTWRTQAEWVSRLSDDLTLLARADFQLADRELLGLEQFAVGGVRSVRGYPQNALIGDNGIAVSAELRWPVYRDRASTLSLIPFIDLGTVWNEDGSRPGNSAVNTAIGTGLGVQWETSDRLFLRLDWGVPLTSLDRDRRTWQDNGLYFSMSYAAF
ncbi:MAG: ShlB/FhaC/HecB family hemolysin secretion/activation protein, partial [Cyanobacteria bacterium J06648_11]